MHKTKDKIQKIDPKVLYMNKPISEISADEIGVGVYVDYLESAIETDADMIAIISGFGTGKSSLIELLKAKYYGWKEEKKQERVYCQVNLWSQLESGVVKTTDETQIEAKTIDLHRSFLYQLISAVYPRKSSYFSRRTGRNFGLFKISAESPLWSVMINIAMILLCVVVLAHSFSDNIVSSGLIEEKLLHLFIIGGYSFCAIVGISLFLRTEIIFSSKNSEKNREIEENELIDLYKEHVLLPKRWFHKLWPWNQSKHIIVVIEDLDRTDAGDSVYLFLKELRKYYVPDEQRESDFVNQITFIVNIMPEDNLQKKCKLSQNKEDYIYDKIFDYSFNLNKINIDNFDVILEALIKEKKTDLTKMGLAVAEKDNVHNIKGMQWIILGKSLSIRQMKDRLNEAIILYDSIRLKFGDDHAEFEKCAVVSYLRSEFPIEFAALSDRTLEKMLNSYAKNQMARNEFVESYWSKDEDVDFYKRIYDMIEAHLIDDSYRTYFYNYPKDSHLYTVRETRVRNLIIYNESITDDLKEDISQVAKERPEAIVDAMRKSIELIADLPSAVLFSVELWQIAKEKFSLFWTSLIYREFSAINEFLPEHRVMLDSMANMDDSKAVLCGAILENEADVIIQIRNYLLEKYPDKIEGYIPLFRCDEAPLRIDEIQKMKMISLEDILTIIKGMVSKLEVEVIDEIHQKIIAEKEQEISKSANFFYSELLEIYDTEDIVDQLFDYMNEIRHLEPELVDAICLAIKEGKIKAYNYFILLNSMPIDEIDQKQLNHIVELDIVGEIDKEICNKLKEAGFYTAYLLNIIGRFTEQIHMSWDEVCAVFERDGKNIWSKHKEEFLHIRAWACEKFKDDMIVLEEFFKAPFPLITVEEIQCMIHPESAMQLYDASRADEDEGEAFVQFCNRQFRRSGVAYSMFEFISKMEKNVIKTVFYKLDMNKVRFSLMGAARKKKIVELLRVSLLLSEANEVIRFMDFTESLLPELEKQIQPDLAKDGALCKAYIKAIQKCGKVTEEAYQNIREMPHIYAFGALINEMLYARKEYIWYVCSKTQEEGRFQIEYEKLDVLWEYYMIIFKNGKRYMKTVPLMAQNKEFLKMIQNRTAYKDLPEDSRLALASIPQDENTLLDVLNYADEFVVKYFSAIVGFTSKKAAQTFVKIMAKHQKYAQKKIIYDNVYLKLENAQLKRKYTMLYRNANN